MALNEADQAAFDQLRDRQGELEHRIDVLETTKHNLMCTALQISEKRNNQIRDLRDGLRKAIHALKEHNREYHHYTPPAFLEDLERLAKG